MATPVVLDMQGVTMVVNTVTRSVLDARVFVPAWSVLVNPS